MLLAICARNSPVTGEFPAQRPVTRSFDVFFDLRLYKWWIKQSWGWWFENAVCEMAAILSRGVSWYYDGYHHTHMKTLTYMLQEFETNLDTSCIMVIVDCLLACRRRKSLNINQLCTWQFKKHIGYAVRLKFHSIALDTYHIKDDSLKKNWYDTMYGTILIILNEIAP